MIFLLPAILWSLAVLILSAIPGNYIPEVSDFWSWLGPDKLAHFALYGGLSFLWLLGLKQYHYKYPRLSYQWLVVLAGTVFGILLEWMQENVFTGRDGNIYDAAANMLGLMLGLAMFHIYNNKKLKHQ